MTIAITGATGQLGRLVVSGIRNRIPADQLVGIVRSAQKASDLGIEVREADYARPETLAPALAGIHTLLLISSNEIGQRAIQHRNVIDAAREAGVKRIVYTSSLHADRSPLSLAAEHRETEEAIKASGIAFTLLRNGGYFENHTASIPGAISGGALVGSAGDGRISAATRADFAEAAVVVLTTAGHEGKTYELAGDSAWTLSDLAAELSRQTGKSIGYTNLPEAEYAGLLKSFGLPDAVAEVIAESDTGASQGAFFDDSRQLSSLIGRPTTTLSAAVTEALQQSA